MKNSILLLLSFLLFTGFGPVGPLPPPGPHPAPPLPTPHPPPLGGTCTGTNPTAISRTPKESGKPVFVFPDDTSLPLTIFLESLPAGATVYFRAGTFSAFTGSTPQPRVHLLKRIHLIGRGTTQSTLQGYLKMEHGSSVEHLNVEAAGAGTRSSVACKSSILRELPCGSRDSRKM